MDAVPSTRDSRLCVACPTRSHCVAAPLTEPELQALAGLMRFARTCDRGRWLFRAGELVRGQFHVRSGTFETVLESADEPLHTVF